MLKMRLWNAAWGLAMFLRVTTAVARDSNGFGNLLDDPSFE
jgi:hypothetical protein